MTWLGILVILPAALTVTMLAFAALVLDHALARSQEPDRALVELTAKHRAGAFQIAEACALRGETSAAPSHGWSKPTAGSPVSKALRSDGPGARPAYAAFLEKDAPTRLSAPPFLLGKTRSWGRRHPETTPAVGISSPITHSLQAPTLARKV